MPFSSDWPHIFDFPLTEKWRVKLCRLGQEKWNVFGEGNIYGEFDESTNEYRLVVEDAEEQGNALFSTTITPPVAFQKQESLLLWNGPVDCILGGNTADDWKDSDGLSRIAIGFQAAAGCASISEFVIYASSKLEDGDEVPFAVQHPGGGDVNFEGFAEVIENPLPLPPLPTALNLTIVLNTISDLLNSLLGREFLIVYLDGKQYLDRLWDVFMEITAPISRQPSTTTTTTTTTTNTDSKASSLLPPLSEQESAPLLAATTISIANASPLERIQMLWTLSDIVKQYFSVGDSYLLEGMASASRFTKVLRMLEYDRAFGARKANFEDYYSHHTDLKQVVEITDAPVVEKIRSTFRLQLLRDLLVRSADDITFHVLRTLIYMNYSEILERLQGSPEFCTKLFGLFDNDLTESTQARDDAVRFVNELMLVSKTFAFSQLRPMYLTLVDRGLLKAISYGLDQSRTPTVKMLALESLSTLMDFDSSLILPFRETVVSSIMSLASCSGVEIHPVRQPLGHDIAGRSKTPYSTKAIQIETAEVLKKMLVDHPAEMLQPFFVELRKVLLESLQQQRRSNSTGTVLATILPFLDILTHCFDSNPETTGDLMKQFGIWRLISCIYLGPSATGTRSLENSSQDISRDADSSLMLDSIGESSETGGPISTRYRQNSSDADADKYENTACAGIYGNNHLDAHASMALIRLVREAIQPPVTVSTYHATDQAECIIDCGLFQGLTKRHIREFSSRPNANDAEQSSFLSLLHVVIEGRRNSTSQQFKIIVRWMTDEGFADTKILCDRYPSIAALLPDIVNTPPRGQNLPHRHELKRASSRQQFHFSTSNGMTSHYPQRPRLAPPINTFQRQIVDEVDDGDDDEVYVLPSSNLSTHLRSNNSPEAHTESLDARDGNQVESRKGTSDESQDGSLDGPQGESHDIHLENNSNVTGGTEGTEGTIGPSKLADSSGERQRSPSPPPHPWWDSPHMHHGIENQDELSERVALMRQPVSSESMARSQH